MRQNPIDTFTHINTIYLKGREGKHNTLAQKFTTIRVTKVGTPSAAARRRPDRCLMGFTSPGGEALQN